MVDSAISVAIRSRPLLDNELPSTDVLRFHPNAVMTPNDKTFNYDFVFQPLTSNESVYNMAVADKIPHLFNGFNVTILAYGSTGSGKTYTMGTDYNPRKSSNSDIGIIPRGLTEIFRVLDSEKDTKDFSVKVSFLELYREIVYDLLNEEASVCQLREFIDGNIKVLNLTEVPVNSIEEAFDILTKGSNIRHTSATAKNSKSSRSHAIFSVYVEQTEKVTLASKRAKFQLVDLAGSERLSTSKTAGVQLKEGIDINLGLLVLGKVIFALCEEKPHIPYRESKLTRLLQDSLGGNSHTVMIACINPSSTSAEETLSTLRYASNTRRIKNRPVVNMDPPAVQIVKLQKQVEALQAALINKQFSTPLDNNRVQQLQDAFAKIVKLNQKLTKLEGANRLINEKLKLFYEDIKSIVADIKIAVGSDGALQSHLEKLELIQSECFQLMVETNQIHSMEFSGLNLQFDKTYKNDESSELVLSSEMDVDSPDCTEMPSKEECMTTAFEDLKDIAASAEYLDKVTRTLEMKQDLARHMQDILEEYKISGVEERDRDLKKQLDILKLDKSDLQALIKKTEERFTKEMQEKVNGYEVQIKKLEEELRKNTKSMMKRIENQTQMEKLQKEIKNLKHTKVQVIKEMRDNANKHLSIQRQKDKDIAKLEREGRKKDLVLTKMETKFEKQLKVLQTKVLAATNSKNKLLQVLEKKIPGKAGVKSKQSQKDVEEWVKEELKIVVDSELGKVEVESLKREADTLKNQIKENEQLSPTAEIDNPQLFDADKLKAELQSLLEQIAVIKHDKEDLTAAKSLNMDEISDLSSAKSVIRWLFKKCTTGEVEAAKQRQIDTENQKIQQALHESYDEKITILNNEIKVLKNEIEKNKAEQERETSALKYEYDSKMLDFVTELQSANQSSLTEVADSMIAKRVEMQEVEIKKLQSLRIKYESKCAEVEKLHREFFKIKKGNRSKWLSDLSNFPEASASLEGKRSATLMEDFLGSETEEENRSMMEEYLSEESFSNDPNDPDWRLTPLHKQVKRTRLEIKAMKNAISKNNGAGSSKADDILDCSPDSESLLKRSFSSCQCLGECKTMRCGCKKRRVLCSVSCSCDKNHCLNIVGVSVSGDNPVSEDCIVPKKKMKLYCQ